MTDVTGMQSAGRVLPLWKGDYYNNILYNRTDVVLYKNSSYIALQDTIGNPPPEPDVNRNDYWQLIAKGIIDADVSGSTVEFTQAATRVNIESGETGATLFGKIEKWFADLKTVAFTNSYTDLDNRPTIPTVNNGTLTIKKNGTNVQTFSANQGTNATANITVPTQASDVGAIPTGKVLTTVEQIDANTDTTNVAGATAVKSLKSDLTNSINQINSNLSKISSSTLDYESVTTDGTSRSYTAANKKCRLYIEVYGQTCFFAYLINGITILQQNVHHPSGIPRGSFMCDLNIGDTFSMYIHSGNIDASRMVIIPYK